MERRGIGHRDRWSLLVVPVGLLGVWGGGELSPWCWLLPGALVLGGCWRIARLPLPRSRPVREGEEDFVHLPPRQDAMLLWISCCLSGLVTTVHEWRGLGEWSLPVGQAAFGVSSLLLAQFWWGGRQRGVLFGERGLVLLPSGGRPEAREFIAWDRVLAVRVLRAGVGVRIQYVPDSVPARADGTGWDSARLSRTGPATRRLWAHHYGVRGVPALAELLNRRAQERATELSASLAQTPSPEVSLPAPFEGRSPT